MGPSISVDGEALGIDPEGYTAEMLQWGRRSASTESGATERAYEDMLRALQWGRRSASTERSGISRTQ